MMILYSYRGNSIARLKQPVHTMRLLLISHVDAKEIVECIPGSPKRSTRHNNKKRALLYRRGKANVTPRTERTEQPR